MTALEKQLVHALDAGEPETLVAVLLRIANHERYSERLDAGLRLQWKHLAQALEEASRTLERLNAPPAAMPEAGTPDETETD